MTIKELIEQLSEFDNDAEVVIKISGYCDTIAEAKDFDVDKRGEVVYLTDM